MFVARDGKANNPCKNALELTLHWSNASIGCPAIWRPCSRLSFPATRAGYRLLTDSSRLAEHPTDGLYCSYHLHASSGDGGDAIYLLIWLYESEKGEHGRLYF